MPKIEFTIPLVPCGQMRARHAARKLKTGKVISTTYKDELQCLREESLFPHLVPHVPPQPITGPILLGVECYMPIPESWSEKRKQAFYQNERLGDPVPYTKTPDLDNAIKHIKDAMTMTRFWSDDKQIYRYLAGTGKYYSRVPRWVITVEFN